MCACVYVAGVRKRLFHRRGGVWFTDGQSKGSAGCPHNPILQNQPKQCGKIGYIYIQLYIHIFYQKFGDAHEPRAKLEPVLAAAVCAVEADYTMWQTAPVLRKIKI